MPYLRESGRESYNNKMPGKSFRGKSALITYRGNQSHSIEKEAYKQKLESIEGVHVEMVGFNSGVNGDNPHVHVLAWHDNEKVYWPSEKFAVDGILPFVSAQKFEGVNSKVGVREYILQNDANALGAIEEGEMQRMKRNRDMNERKADAPIMSEVFKLLGDCTNSDEVDALYQEGRLPLNKTSKVWREEWTRVKAREIAQKTHEMSEITLNIPVVYMPSTPEKMEMQKLTFKFDAMHTSVFEDIRGNKAERTKKFILHVFSEIPGVGKTPSIEATLEEQKIPYYRVPSCSEPMTWFDGYKGEPVIWSDDNEMCSPGQLLSLIESTQLPIKGGFVNKSNFKVVWIFSNNLSFRKMFNRFKSESDRIKIEALYARTIQIEMYPNEELQETQKPVYVHRGIIYETLEEFHQKCEEERNIEMNEERAYDGVLYDAEVGDDGSLHKFFKRMSDGSKYSEKYLKNGEIEGRYEVKE
jgi:hypothetical protein